MCLTLEVSWSFFVRTGAKWMSQKITKIFIIFAASPHENRKSYQKSVDNFCGATSLHDIYRATARLVKICRRRYVLRDVKKIADSAVGRLPFKMAAFL